MAANFSVNKKVSVVVVSYNAEEYISKTLLSCLNQTHANLEVLLLDNGSKDRTIEIAKDIQKKDDRLRIFESKENLGPYAGLNYLLDRAEGEYIAIQDHDDIWFPEKVQKQINFLEKNRDFVACGTNTFYFYEGKGTVVLNSKPNITNFVDHTSLMFRNGVFRYDPSYLLSDEHFEKKVLGDSGRIACLPEGLTVHRLKSDGGNLSSTRFFLSWKNIKEFVSLNGVSLGSMFYFLDLVFARFFPERILWFVRRKITQRDRLWLIVEEFDRRYPGIL